MKFDNCSFNNARLTDYTGMLTFSNCRGTITVTNGTDRKEINLGDYPILQVIMEKNSVFLIVPI